jgi:hypothetical protein
MTPAEDAGTHDQAADAAAPHSLKLDRNFRPYRVLCNSSDDAENPRPMYARSFSRCKKS